MLIYVDESGNWDPEPSSEKFLTLGAVVFPDETFAKELYEENLNKLQRKHAVKVPDPEYDAVVDILASGNLKKVAGYIERQRLIHPQGSPLLSATLWGNALAFLLSPLLVFSPQGGTTLTIAGRSFEQSYEEENWEERQPSRLNENVIRQWLYSETQSILRSLKREDLLSNVTQDRLDIQFKSVRGAGRDNCLLVLADFLANLAYRHLSNPQNARHKNRFDKARPVLVPLEI